MPNHVRNRLIIKAEEAKVKEITDFLMGEPFQDGTPCYMDFNKIIPMPAELDVENGSSGEIGEAILDKKGASIRPILKSKSGSMNSNRNSSKNICSSVVGINPTAKSTATPHGTTGVSKIGVRSGTPTASKNRRTMKYGSTQHGLA